MQNIESQLSKHTQFKPSEPVSVQPTDSQQLQLPNYHPGGEHVNPGTSELYPAHPPHTGKTKRRCKAQNRASKTDMCNTGGLCFICQSPNHHASSCPQRIKPEMCVICREMDHKHYECPQNPYRTVPVNVPQQPILLPSNQSNVCEYCFQSGHTVHQCQQIVP